MIIKRYGSKAMHHIWSEETKRRLWRRIWYVVAAVQREERGAIYSAEDIQKLEEHVNDINLPRSLEIEAEVHHDLVAEMMAYMEQTGVERLHIGLTSSDVTDNAIYAQQMVSLTEISDGLRTLIWQMIDRVAEWCNLVIPGMTHLQVAEPTTLGYRLAPTLIELSSSMAELRLLSATLWSKGLTGAVGTAAGEDITQVSLRKAEQQLGLHPPAATGQTSPRSSDRRVLFMLAGLAAALSKLATDIRLMMADEILMEEDTDRHVGSSAMPHKINPIGWEKIVSLGRLVRNHAMTAWDNQANLWLERSLDDSANRRTILPESFLLMDEMLTTAIREFAKLQPNEQAITEALKDRRLMTGHLMTKMMTNGLRYEAAREHALGMVTDDQYKIPDPRSYVGNAPAMALLVITGAISNLMQDEISDAEEDAES